MNLLAWILCLCVAVYVYGMLVICYCDFCYFSVALIDFAASASTSDLPGVIVAEMT